MKKILNNSKLCTDIILCTNIINKIVKLTNVPRSKVCCKSYYKSYYIINQIRSKLKIGKLHRTEFTLLVEATEVKTIRDAIESWQFNLEYCCSNRFKYSPNKLLQLNDLVQKRDLLQSHTTIPYEMLSQDKGVVKLRHKRTWQRLMRGEKGAALEGMEHNYRIYKDDQLQAKLQAKLKQEMKEIKRVSKDISALKQQISGRLFLVSDGEEE